MCYPLTLKICFFADPPSITFEEVDPIEDGSELHLLCSASGIPTPSITIYRNDEKVSGPLPGGSLEYTVTSASAKNNHGTYSCNASSISNITGLPFPTASKSIQVIVQGLIKHPVQYGNAQYIRLSSCLQVYLIKSVDQISLKTTLSI